MIYTTEQLTTKLGSFFKVKQAVRNGEYFKVSHGLYSDKSPYLCELEKLFMRFPNAVLTLQSAFAYYGLSDYIPEKYVVATSQRAHPIRDKKVAQIYVTDDLLDVGKKVVETQYGTINIYDRERLLIELFRFKNKLSYAYYKEVVDSYRKLAKNEELDFNKIVKYCYQFKRGSYIRKQIQEVIL